MSRDTTVVRRFSEEEQGRRQAETEEQRRKRALRLLLLTNTIRSAYEYAKRNGALLELEELAFPEAKKTSSAVAMLALEALQYPATFGDINRKISGALTPLEAASVLWDEFRSLRSREQNFSRQRLIMEMMRDAEHHTACGSRLRFVSSVFLKCLRQTDEEHTLQMETRSRLCDECFSDTGFMEWAKLHPLSDQYIIYDIVRCEAHDPSVSVRAVQIRDLLKKQLML